MTTVDPDLAADTMALQGPGDNEEEKLQVQPFKVPDDAAPQWAMWGAATAEQVRHHLSRKCAEAVTVSSMVQEMKADDFDPEEEEFRALCTHAPASALWPWPPNCESARLDFNLGHSTTSQ